jgi:hypothetical protein
MPILNFNRMLIRVVADGVNEAQNKEFSKVSLNRSSWLFGLTSRCRRREQGMAFKVYGIPARF